MDDGSITVPGGDDMPDPRLRIDVDPDGMRDDGCDDVSIPGYVRPLHGHATTGDVHAHPGGGLAHTHDRVATQVRAIAAGWHTGRQQSVNGPFLAHWWLRDGRLLCTEGTLRYQGEKLDQPPSVAEVCPGASLPSIRRPSGSG